MVELVGEKYAKRIEELALELYTTVCLPVQGGERFIELIRSSTGQGLRRGARHHHCGHQVRVRSERERRDCSRGRGSHSRYVSTPFCHVKPLTGKDSSRFWLASAYEVGKGQDSYDKQFLRDWLTANGVKGKEGVEMPEDIAKKTGEKYIEAYELLTGRKWNP